MVKKFLAIALTTVLAITTVWAVVPLSAFADEMPVYQASKEFVNTSANLEQYNPGDNWDWNCYVYGNDINWSGKDYQGGSYSSMTVAPSGDNQKFLNTTAFPVPDGEEVAGEVYSISGDGVGIGKYWMRGFRHISSTSAKLEYFNRVYAVRTFKAKEAGKVTIIAADRFGKSAIEGSHDAQASDEKNQRGVRVVQERDGVKTQLWPTEQNRGVLETVTYNEAVYAIVPKSSTIDFPALTTMLQAGDNLHFELANVSPDPVDNSKYGCAVYWDPVVRYNSFVSVTDFQPTVTEDLPLNQVFTIAADGEIEPIVASNISVSGTTEAAVRDFSFTKGNTISFAFDGLAYNGTYEVEVGGLKPVGSSGEGEVYRFTFTTITLKQYRASDYYDADGKNNPYTVDGKAPWIWESYDLKTKTYMRLPSFNSSRGYAVVGNYNAVTAVSGSAMYGDTRQNGQGGFTADETYTYAWQRYYPVRTFTVPESGKVTLSAAGGTITAPGSAAPGLRILLERNGEFTQLWPEAGWKSVNASAPVHFAPMVQNVIEGDNLHFELSAAEASTSSCWTMYANWDPVVAYNEKHPTVTGIFPENGAADVPGNTEFVVSFSQEICEPSVQDAEIDGDAAVEGIWSENGNEVHILLDSTTLKEKTSYTLRLKNIRLKNFDEQNSFEQRIIFTTSDYTVFGEFSRSGASVILPINNTIGVTRPMSVTMLVVLCQGTPERYTVKSAWHQTEVITGKQDMSITLDTVPGNGEFVKAVAVTAPAFGKLLTDMAILE